MARPPSEDESALSADADIAQALKDLLRGEQTATALEKHLDTLERKIEDLLAEAEKNQKDNQRHFAQTTTAEKASSGKDPAAGTRGNA